MTLPAANDNLGSWSGYHSPQVAVTVRLNTNESPYPPPAAYVTRWPRPCAPPPSTGIPTRSYRALRTSWRTATVWPRAGVLRQRLHEVLRPCSSPTAGRGTRPRCSSRPTPCTRRSPG